jgi:hypothetical protein
MVSNWRAVYEISTNLNSRNSSSSEMASMSRGIGRPSSFAGLAAGSFPFDLDDLGGGGLRDYETAVARGTD